MSQEGYDPTGPLEQRSVVNAKDGWSTYTLDDGSVISVKASLVDVKRAIDQFAPNGDPIYVFTIAAAHNVVVPK